MKSEQSMVSNEKHEEHAFVYQILKSPEQRTMLAARIDAMAERVHKEGVTTLVFLDKSARPLATMFRDIWNHRYQGQKAPEIKFLNVGTELTKKLKALFTLKETDTPEEQVKKKALIDGLIKRLEDNIDEGLNEDLLYMIRLHDDSAYYDPDGLEDALFATWLKALPPETFYALLGDDAWDGFRHRRNFLRTGDEKQPNVLVVDEYAYTGGSVALAKKILESAYGEQFPGMQIEATALATGMYDPLFSVSGYYHNPPWRKDSDSSPEGMTGVKDREGLFAAALRDDDPQENRNLARQLSKEMRQAAQDYLTGRVAYYFPSPARSRAPENN